MEHLAYQEIEKRGERYEMVKRKNSPYGCNLLEYVCMDQYRRYFIASGSSMDDGANTKRIRSHSTNSDPVDVTLTILQPKASEIYYGD